MRFQYEGTPQNYHTRTCAQTLSIFRGIVRENKIKLLAVGGMPDHVYLLISMPSTISIAKAIQFLKGSSSKWIHETFPEQRLFEWQSGYGAFSIGVSDFERTVKYIKNQVSHHEKRNFEEEYLAFVRKNGLEYDERYVFDCYVLIENFFRPFRTLNFIVNKS